MAESSLNFKTVFVSGLSARVQEEHIRAHFHACGKVRLVSFGRAKDGVKGWWVAFDHAGAYDRAAALDGSLVEGERARVQRVCKFVVCLSSSPAHIEALAHLPHDGSTALSSLGRVAVDPLNSGDLTTKRVHVDGAGRVWHAELRKGASYYRLQLVEDLFDRLFLVFARWGDINGERKDQHQTITCESLEGAMHVFEKKVSSKTGYSWPPPPCCEPREGKFVFVPPPIVTAVLPSLVADDSEVMRRVKQFVLEGGDIAGLHVVPNRRQHQPTLALLAAPDRVPGLPVIDFLLKLGAPIVIVSGATRHDAFLAMLAIPRLSKDAVVRATAVLQRFLDAGYEIDGAVGATLVKAARGSFDAMHEWMVRRIAERGVRIAVDSCAFFEADNETPPEFILRELEILDVSADAIRGLFALLVRRPGALRSGSSRALFERVLLMLPDAPACIAAELRNVVNLDMLAELLKLVEPTQAPLELREFALLRVVSVHSPSPSLLALAFERSGLDVNHELSGATPLVHAIKRKSAVSTIAWLVNRGANVNVVDGDGNTPLHLSRDAAVDAVLVRGGADPGQRNRAGQTPFDLVDCSLTGDVERHWFFAKELREIVANRLKDQA